MATKLPANTRANRMRRPFRWPVLAIVLIVIGIVGIALVILVR